MKEGHPQTVYLKDYTPPAYLITDVHLDFILDEEVTVVTSNMQVTRNPQSNEQTTTLELDGEELVLDYIELDGVRLTSDQYVLSDQTLHIQNVPEKFELSIRNEITPQINTSLEGLYKSSGNFCTQCEAQGFRKITYFLDRPDVMSIFTVRLQADKSRYPVLLSNGNPVEQGDCEDSQHFAVWNDPFPKPSYLFALVAADLVYLEGHHCTTSGKDVVLRIYTEKHNADKIEHALSSLQKAMLWDERRFGLECDLDIYMIVAVDDFNMGAMENKGLNIFNSSCVLARPDTSTDADYMHIEAVVAHEYFHNWTGNRVTCRDWFQLSLKEGLTVFRDQEFTSDVTSRAVKRISDVRFLRSHQFAEDASPMAHPVRPASFVEINNFYTLTVYEKGAEIVRMYQTMFGVEGFRKGMDLYFQRHDGQAVTTDDFAAAMADANNVDLAQFKLWYEQAGTPCVDVTDEWDATSNSYQLTFKQSCPVAPQNENNTDVKHPLLIPVKTSLLNTAGDLIPLHINDQTDAAVTTIILHLNELQQSFRFENIKDQPIPDLLQEFSAPVHMKYNFSNEHLALLLKHSSDAFNRWNAGNRLTMKVLLERVAEPKHAEVSNSLLTLNQALAHAMRLGNTDNSLLAELLILPNEKDLEEHVDVIDMQAIVLACESLQQAVAQHLEEDLLKAYHACQRTVEYQYNAQEMGRRRLQNACLQLLTALGKAEYLQLALQQFNQASNMTEQAGAINALLHQESEEREQALASFEQQWTHDSLVMDKWLAFHARSKIPDVLMKVKKLMQHPVFTLQNPNKVRALIGVFAGQNSYAFHDASGNGYEFIANQVIALDKLNPQVASRLVRTLMRWQKYAQPFKQNMYEQLEFIATQKNLSKDVHEIVSKSLLPIE